MNGDVVEVNGLRFRWTMEPARKKAESGKPQHWNSALMAMFPGPIGDETAEAVGALVQERVKNNVFQGSDPGLEHRVRWNGSMVSVEVSLNNETS